MKAHLRRGLRFFLKILVIPLFLSLQARGRVYVVTDTNDSTQITSLRWAIIDANRHSGNNTIILGEPGFHPFTGHRFSHWSNPGQNQQWIFRLTIFGADEDIAFTGDLDITRGNLTIIGADSNVIIDATGMGDRVFQVFSNAHLTLENLIITGGTASGNGNGIFADGEPGGAICNAGFLILEHCIITNNASGGGQFVEGNGGGTGGGGGIYNSGVFWASDCSIVRNSSGGGVDGAYGGGGGGIRNDGFCLLTTCIITGNQSGVGGGPAGNAIGFGGSGGNGGGIFNSGTMILSGCIVDVNAAGSGAGGGDPSWGTINSPGGPGGNGGNGGGIYNVGHMELNFSTIDANACGNGGNGGSFAGGGNAGTGGSGAGIFNAGKLSLNTSTISGNLCGNGGNGGSGSRGDGATGGAGGAGGGIYNADLLDLTSSTITLNQTGIGGNGGDSQSFDNPSATGASGGQGGDGGGILNAGNTAVVLRNTLVALNLINAGGAGGTNADTPFPVIGATNTVTEQIGNSGAGGVGPDLAGDFTSQGYNLIGMADGSTGFVNVVNADKIGSITAPIDPLIGPLQMNGGPTPTHALLPGSPAIDQGNSFGIDTDQRGRHRPYNFFSVPNAIGGDGSDIGAFELSPN